MVRIGTLAAWSLAVLGCGIDGPPPLVGSLTASADTCGIAFGEGTCATSLAWSSADVEAPSVQVRALGAVVACGPANEAGEVTTANIVGAAGTRFELRPAASCEPLAELGPPLAEAIVTGTFAPPTCGTTPLGEVPPDFAGIIGFGTHSGLGTAGNIARQMHEADVSYVRVFANWHMIELAAGAPYDWTDRDNIIGSFLDAGNEVILTLGYPPAWRSSAPAGDPTPTVYPPADLAQWDAYVRAVVERYGDRVHHWQVWNEPDLLGGFKLNNDPRTREVAYVDLLNRTAGVIRTLDPGAKIWGPDVISSSMYGAQFATEALRRGELDHFTIHVFQPTVAAMIPELATYQALAQELRPGMPVSVTATQVTAAPPRRLACPFVGVPELEQARAVQDIYACLGNAGARHVFMFKTHDRILANYRTYADGTPDPGNPDGYELNGLLGPHPLGSFAEAIGQCVTSDCGQLEHRKKPAFWAVRAVTAHARGQ